MEQGNTENTGTLTQQAPDIRAIVREAIEEYTRREQSKAEPAYKNELLEERKRREQLERRVNELVQESARSRQAAEEAERGATLRTELQKLGVTKVDLAFKAIKDDVKRAEDGRLVAQSESGPVNLREYLTQFVNENPEFLPARNLGGSGVTAGQRASTPAGSTPDLDKIRPGMSPEELDKVRQEVARIASQTLGGR
ncbi:MAG: hypothetical protein IT159_15485 [Bryobacterales bacterium]|nr:hypothetical protein [Bryobacterales bacterium]